MRPTVVIGIPRNTVTSSFDEATRAPQVNQLLVRNPPAASPRCHDIEPATVVVEHPPGLGRAEAAEHRAFTAREHRRNAPAVRRDLRMTDCVHAGKETMQTACLCTILRGPSAQSGLADLPESDDAFLAGSEPCQLRVDLVWSDPFALHIPRSCPIDGHTGRHERGSSPQCCRRQHIGVATHRCRRRPEWARERDRHRARQAHPQLKRRAAPVGPSSAVASRSTGPPLRSVRRDRGARGSRGRPDRAPAYAASASSWRST